MSDKTENLNHTIYQSVWAPTVAKFRKKEMKQYINKTVCYSNPIMFLKHSIPYNKYYMYMLFRCLLLAQLYSGTYHHKSICRLDRMMTSMGKQLHSTHTVRTARAAL